MKRIILGDCAAILPTLPGAFARLIYIDPPFNTGRVQRRARVEVTAAATFYMAEIYANFGQALRESERPADLGAEALKDYEQQLADAAHPLDEKAIAVHEKNLELMRRVLSNVWTQKSLDRLAALKPETYARAEISSGFLGSLERYVYQPPPRVVEAALTAGVGNANSH